jgi:hypothetical protein
MASMSDGECGVGEALSRNDKHTEINEREVGRVASQARKTELNGKGDSGPRLPGPPEARRGRIYCKRDIYETRYSTERRVS